MCQLFKSTNSIHFSVMFNQNSIPVFIMPTYLDMYQLLKEFSAPKVTVPLRCHCTFPFMFACGQRVKVITLLFAQRHQAPPLLRRRRRVGCQAGKGFPAFFLHSFVFDAPFWEAASSGGKLLLLREYNSI
jgi:hypothetical protein